MLPGTSYMVIGVENYGILIYCMVDFKVVKLISLISYANY